MKKPLAILVNPDIGNQAQIVCNDMGLDIVTVVDHFLRQFVLKEPSILQVVHPLIAIGKPEKLGDGEGKANVTEGFNAPIGNYYTPANTPEERRAIVDSLIGSIDDPTFAEPLELDFADDAPRNWELMDA